MQTIGDLILLLSIGVALWYVPRYLWRVYGGADIVNRFMRWYGAFRPSRSGPEQADDNPQTNPQAPIRSQQDQVRTDRTVSFEDVRMWIAEHNMTDEQAVILFATAHRQPDDFFLSANKIRDGIGGARDEVLAKVAQCRPRPKAPKPSNRLERPKEGWRSAS